MKIEPEEGELMEEEAVQECSFESQTSTAHLKRISGGVLQLNFMRKSFNQIVSSERKDKKKVNEQNRIYPTVLQADDDPVPGPDGITRDDRFTWVEDLGFGRFSYHGQNSEIEKLMNLHKNGEQEEPGELKMETEDS